MTTLTPTVVDAVPVFVELATGSFVDVLAGTGTPPISILSPKDARAVLDQAQVQTVAAAPAEVGPRTIPHNPLEGATITVDRTSGTIGSLRAVVYIDGGWILDNFGTPERLFPALAAGTSATIVFVHYTPSPAGAPLSPEGTITDALVDEPIKASTTIAPAEGLSPREREVLVLVAQGQTNKEIAGALFVAPSTIKTHVASLLAKLNAGTRAHLATIATQRGLLPN